MHKKQIILHRFHTRPLHTTATAVAVAVVVVVVVVVGGGGDINNI